MILVFYDGLFEVTFHWIHAILRKMPLKESFLKNLRDLIYSALVGSAILMGCKDSVPIATPTPASPHYSLSSANGERIMLAVEEFLKQGPRPSGSTASKKSADYLKSKIEECCMRPAMMSFVI